MKQMQTNLPPCEIYIDKEGRWFHKGAEMTRRDFIRLFYQNMELNSAGQYVINWKGQSCYVDVEDTAFVVHRAVYEDPVPNQEGRFILYLNDDTKEELLPDTLYVGNEHVLYCAVKNRTYPARFNRASYYQIAQYIEEENGSYFLRLNGIKHVIYQGTVP